MDEQLFDFGGHKVRVVLGENKEPRFVPKDVCDVLELQAPHMVAGRVEEDDRSTTSVIDHLGRSQQVTTVNESGLYHVISSPASRKLRGSVAG